MQITTTEAREHHVTVSLSGRLDAFSASNVQIELEQLCSKGILHFVLDLSKVEFLDSAGLAVLVTLLKQVQQQDGSVKMVPPEAHTAYRILHLTRFDRIFELVPLPQI